MLLAIQVIPKAKLNKIIRTDNHTYRIHTTAAPDKNKANQSVIKLISQELNISKNRITIIKGEKDRKKIIQIHN